jgi:sialic acid synthase SpsE
MKSITLGSRLVSEYTTPLVIAEIGANFNGDLEIAKKMIIEAKRVGVEAVKFQCWSKDNIVVASAWENKEASMKAFGHTREDELLDYLSLDHAGHREMAAFCNEQEIMFSSTPTSFADVDFLDELDVPFYKIASMDLDHLSFLEYVGKKGRPIIISSGIGTVQEIALALEAIKKTGNEDIILLHCTSLYPPHENEVNLNNIDFLRDVFDVQVGYSDHTIGHSIPLASVAKGVSVIEKHFTLDKAMEGWDHAVSATPEEFEIIVKESRRVCDALGNKERKLSQRELDNKVNFRRSIVAVRNLQKGTTLKFEDLSFKRPGSGLSPNQYEKLIGRALTQDMAKDDQFSLGHFD